MSYVPEDLLMHIWNEINFLSNFINIEFSDLNSDGLKKRAVTRSLEIIGEAVKKLPAQFKNQHPNIDWKKLAGTRDIMIHDYFGIDYGIVHDILQNKIPKLKIEIESILIDLRISFEDKSQLF